MNLVFISFSSVLPFRHKHGVKDCTLFLLHRNHKNVSLDEKDAVYQKEIGVTTGSDQSHRTVEIVFANPSAADVGDYVCSITNIQLPEEQHENKMIVVTSM